MKNINDIINYLANKEIIIMCGHYGSGKTNLSVNFAIKLKEQTGFGCTLADLDMVNPYFRSADNEEDLKKHGVNLIIPPFANTSLDVSAIPPEIYSVFVKKSEPRHAIIDVGGDGNGALVLGMFADKIKQTDYEMIYVVNKYRNLTKDAEAAVNLAKHIEHVSTLKITSLINNSNIGGLTTGKEVMDSVSYAQNISDLLNIPMLGTSYMTDIDVDFSGEMLYNMFKIKNYTKKLW